MLEMLGRKKEEKNDDGHVSCVTFHVDINLEDSRSHSGADGKHTDGK